MEINENGLHRIRVLLEMRQEHEEKIAKGLLPPDTPFKFDILAYWQAYWQAAQTVHVIA